MKILSLIVPAYNSAAFLNRCVDSFLEPRVLEKLDIILVNDGSRDETPEIGKRYAETYPGSVRLISQDNRGHGGALNTGCAAAVGKYLKVIDADDWVVTENLPAYLAFLEGCESDVVLTHHHTVDISTGEVKSWKSYPDRFGAAYSLREIMLRWKDFDRSLTFHGITYRTEFYHRYGIGLSEHVFYEDHEFATFPCCRAGSVSPCDLFLYEYRIGDVAQSVSAENQLRRIGHTETVLKRLASEYARQLPELDDGARAYVCMKAQGLLMSYLTTMLLVDPDRKQGSARAGEMMAFFRDAIPGTYEKARKQYRILFVLNGLGISKNAFDRVLGSRLYNRLRGNHTFE